MARNLAAAVRAATEALENTTPWAWLYYITLAGGDYVAVTNHVSPIRYPETGNVVFMPYPVSAPELSEDTEGNLTTVSISISNVTRVLSQLLESGELQKQALTIYLVNIDHLASGEAAISQTFCVQDVTANMISASFKLGPPDLFGHTFPRRTYNKLMCPRIFGTSTDPIAGCGWDGVTGAASCRHTLTDCRNHGNVINYGGFPAIPRRYA